jgi:hypothetical protein
MSAALWITPPDDNELFPVEALNLQPRAMVGLIPAIDTFRDDAFNAVFAGQPMKRRAMPDLVIVVSQAIRQTIQQRCQPGLAVHQLIQNATDTGEGSLVFFLFDMLHLEGEDLTSLPLVYGPVL